MLKLLNQSIFLTLGSAIGSQVSLRVACHTQARPMPHQFSKALDHPLRMKYRDPVETLGPFGIAPGMTVLDLGCGTGTFTVEIARMVGENGIVHAVDLQPPLIEQTRLRLGETGMLDR